jgi:hypothetical protein
LAVIATQMLALRIFDMKKSYRFLSGVDDAAFCQRVSDVLAEGYVLYGNPVMVMDNGNRIVGQAVILPDMVQDHQALKQDQSL